MLMEGMERIRSVARSATVALAAIVAAACSATPTEPAPIEPAPIGVEMRKVPVAMYMTDWCPYCDRARDWLREGGYSFVEHDVERDERAAAVLIALNPRGSVPMFDVDGRIVIGFEPDVLQAAIRDAVADRKSGGGWGSAAPY
jgi:glutaredoxin